MKRQMVQGKDYLNLFSPAIESSSRNNFSKAVFGIISQEKFDFSGVFEKNFDFYSTIFEYLIKDYNVASGVYAEYFTPQAVSSIIARCLVGMSETIQASEIYDPSAGSGSLVLHLGHELGEDDGINRAIVYSQDISSKSTRFLRINMLLNGMTESLGNIIQGDTLIKPSHYKKEHDPSSGLKKFDYITSNPPFKMDFSATRGEIEQKWLDTGRFFAGVPNVPPKKKDSMAIYLLFYTTYFIFFKRKRKSGNSGSNWICYSTNRN
ncbi:N-6 DNA methylase [Peribacillus frigoritolerans]|nr:N-6 DNA methylase [Peribacillus frigoritolerans]